MTPFSQIYKLTMSLLDKNERIENMDLDLKLDLFSDLIIMTSNADFTDCKKDLSLVTPYIQQVASKKTLIGSHTTSIDLPNELIEYEGIIIMRNGEELKNATSEIDNDNNVITITWNDSILNDYEFEDEVIIDVIFYKDGYFEEDLNSREKTILAYGVLTGLVSQEINKEDLIKANISDKDYSITGRQQIYNNILKKQEFFQLKLDKYLHDYTYGVATSYEDLM